MVLFACTLGLYLGPISYTVKSARDSFTPAGKDELF